jgi:hypothetical protein
MDPKSRKLPSVASFSVSTELVPSSEGGLQIRRNCSQWHKYQIWLYWFPEDKLEQKPIDFRCFDCGCKGTKENWLERHHLDHKAINDNLNNLILLCKKCHTIEHPFRIDYKRKKCKYGNNNTY